MRDALAAGKYGAAEAPSYVRKRRTAVRQAWPSWGRAGNESAVDGVPDGGKPSPRRRVLTTCLSTVQYAYNAYS